MIPFREEEADEIILMDEINAEVVSQLSCQMVMSALFGFYALAV